jgi:hypothetical protein
MQLSMRTAMTPGLAALVAVIWLALGVAPLHAGSPGRYDDYRHGAYLPYLNAPGANDDIATLPRLRISFGERSYGAVMDTGSTGIVVSADKIPNIDHLRSLGPGKLTYSSSGRIMTGRWVVTPVTIAGADGASVTTSTIPVLAVTRIECTATARRCTPNESPRGVSMLGIGFGRPSSTDLNDDQAQSRPNKNPFLNIAAISGDGSNATRVQRGYVVTRQGVHVGLTADNTRGDFAYVKLAPAANGRDWAPMPACISINGATPAACGTLLMDTGVTTMYLTVPEDQAAPDIRTWDGRSPTLRAGTQVTISVPTEEKAAAFYTFKLGGEGNPLAPAHLVLVGGARAPFVNTSVRFLNGFDYFYDADGGFVGLRWTGRAAPTIGKVVPPN